MGFCPYFLHAHRSEGTTSPLDLLLAAAGAGIQTTFFAWLFLHNHVEQLMLNLKQEEGGDDFITEELDTKIPSKLSLGRASIFV